MEQGIDKHVVENMIQRSINSLYDVFVHEHAHEKEHEHISERHDELKEEVGDMRTEIRSLNTCMAKKFTKLWYGVFAMLGGIIATLVAVIVRWK